MPWLLTWLQYSLKPITALFGKEFDRAWKYPIAQWYMNSMKMYDC